MKFSKIFLLSAFAALALSSCSEDYFPSNDSRQGSMSLAVEKKKPISTRAIETSDFPVSIYSLKDNKLVENFEKASMVPNKLTMSVGKYYAEAHTPGEFETIMDAPYYLGRDTFDILQGINTNSTVICRQANGSFTIRFSDDFSESFADWSISINDGVERAITYTRSEHGLNPATIYVKFKENTEFFTVNFTGKTVKGVSIATSSKLQKSAAAEKYDNDDPYFSGGDAIVIVFAPVEGTDGTITGITLNADITFEEMDPDNSFELDVTDNMPESGDDNEQPGNSDAITLNLPSNMVIDETTDPSLGDTEIKAAAGIKSVKVNISSTSEDMLSSLADLADNYDDIDFLGAGTEVVANQGMVTLFEDLGQTLEVPAMGDVEYVFPIGNFFGLLQFLPGLHTFELTITDMQGNVKSGKLLLAVGEELPGDSGSEVAGITLNLPKNMTITAETDPSLGDTEIKASAGIKSIKVKITSTSEDMVSSLADLADNYDGIDFLGAGTEVVANQGMVALFEDLGQTLEVPATGDVEYVFPIGNFFGFLMFLPGDHSFELVVTDMQGNTKSGSLTLTVE